jgi:hypothetical protein
MHFRSALVSIAGLLWSVAAVHVTALPATPAAPITSSAENEISSPSEGTEKVRDVLISPLSGEFSKVAGVLATIASSIEDQIRIPQTMMAEEALVRMQQVRPLIDEGLSKWGHDHTIW